MKISIVIPVYNTATTLLRHCLDSIQKQTYENFECVIVDDGSVHEETKNFLQNYIKNKNKFILINLKKNMGPGHARNEGIRHSSGDVITFSDSDDYMREDTLDAIQKTFSKNSGLEIFSFESLIHLRNGKFRKSADYTFETGVVSIDTFNNGVLDKCSVWAKAYSREFLFEKKIFFLEENLFMEDLYFFIISYSKAKKIIFSKQQLYILNDNENSRSLSKFTLKKARDIYKIVCQAYLTIKNDDSYISRNFGKLFSLWFFHKLKEANADFLFKDNYEYKLLIQKAIEFQNSILKPNE